MQIGLSQYRDCLILFLQTRGSLDLCYCRKMYSCKFVLVILFIHLQAFSSLIGFFKKIVWKNMLMVQINKTFLISCFYLFLSWLFPRLIHLNGDIEKSSGPKKDVSQMFSIGLWNLNSLVAHSFTKVALLMIHWRLSTILKTSKRVYEIMFVTCKSMYILKCIKYTIY